MRTLHNFRLTDSIFESVRRLLSWSGQQHTNVLASLRPAYITQLLGVSRQIIRHLGVSRLMYSRHKKQRHLWLLHFDSSHFWQIYVGELVHYYCLYFEWNLLLGDSHRMNYKSRSAIVYHHTLPKIAYSCIHVCLVK